MGTITLFAQQKIAGIVTGVNGSPLLGATISIKGSKNGTVTNSEGSFVIIVKSQDILIITFVGYNSKQVRVGNGTYLKISLEPSISDLDQVVVTGYTSQKIKEIAGSVAVVNPKELTATPAGQVEQMLQGRVAGLAVITSGEPGTTATIRLHGIGNFGDVAPLYIIDGVQGNINSINPYDIESLQVLKDAGAYSIYGVRGANGVIVITTKKGKNAKTQISYDFYAGWQQPLNKGLDILSPQENADLKWLAFKNSGQTPSDPLYGNGAKPVLPDYIFAGSNSNSGLFEGSPLVNPNKYSLDSPVYQIVRFNKMGTDWFHELFKPSVSQNHIISISGGNDKNRYFFSFGYLDQQGTYINTFLKRYTARINADFEVKNFIRVGENLQLAYLNNPQSKGSVWFPLIGTPSYLPVYDIKGNWSSLGFPFYGPTTDNPLASRRLAKDDRNNSWQIFGNTFAEARFLKWFTAKTSVGGSLNNFYSYNYSYGSYDRIAPSSFTENSGYLSSWTWTNTLNFSKTLWNQHHIDALVGIEQINNYNRSQGGSRSAYFTDNPNYRFLQNGNPAGQNNYSAATTSFLSSFISQVDYNFLNEYFFRTTLRRDGSSVFGPQERFGWFPSFSAAWRITETKFLKNSNWLTDLKLRGSWGKTGFYGNTDPLNQFTLYGGTAGDAFYDIFGTSNNVVRGFRVVRIGNPKTGWQEDIVANIGFESILWNGKLSITTDYYKKKSTGLLFQLSLPDILGSAIRPNANVGNVENHGIDILLGSKGKFSKNWKWDVGVTFTSYNNKIIKLNDIPYFDVPLPFYGMVRNAVGHPMGSFYGFKIIGLFQSADDVNKSPIQNAASPGRFKYADVNGRDSTGKLTGKPDGKITDDDRVFIGSPNPKLTIGVNTGISYKNFDFSTFFYGSFGNDVLNALRMVTDIYPTATNNTPFSPKSKTALYDSWTPQHTNAKAPIVENEQNFSNVAAPNSYPIEKGSYFRNKSIILGYTLPGNWLQKLKIDRFRFYVQVVNLFTITKYSGLDPELPGNNQKVNTSQAWGFDPGNYPNNQKQYLIGATLNF